LVNCVLGWVTFVQKLVNCVLGWVTFVQKLVNCLLDWVTFVLFQALYNLSISGFVCIRIKRLEMTMHKK